MHIFFTAILTIGLTIGLTLLRFWALIVLLFWIPDPVSANETILSPIVVTATRNPQAINKLATATTVYTREDIERLQVRSLPELLKGSAGIDMTQSGGPGKTTSFFMRGTESDHVLVMIDGIKAGSATAGTTAFELLPIDQIERVEIVRGPHSSIYGSEAIGGVIQIFTRRGDHDEPRISGSLGGGGYDSFQSHGAVSGGYKDAWYDLALGYTGTQGFDAKRPTSGFFGVNQPDGDGYHNQNISARVGYKLTDTADVEGFFMRAWGETELDGFTDQDTNFIQQAAGGAVTLDLTNFWHMSLRGGLTRDEGDNDPMPGMSPSYFDTKRWDLRWQNDFTVRAGHIVTVGTDYQNDEVDSSTSYDERSRYDVGVFGQYQGEWRGHNITASVRWDHNEAFGNETTGSVGWNYRIKYGLRILASYGTAFKTPSFNELYFPNFGNPDLEPESSESFEVGIGGDHDWLHWTVRAYHTDVTELIATAFNATTGSFTAENISAARIEGVEGELNVHYGDWRGDLSINFLDPEDQATGLRLPRRAERILRLDLSRTLGRFKLGGSLLAQNERYDNTGNTIRVPGYATVALRGVYNFHKQWSLRASLDNLLDKTYETVNTFASAGRQYFITLHYQGD